MTGTRHPVTSWETDFDFLDEEYTADPFSIWQHLRDRCPVAHTDRYHGVYMPTRYEDIAAVAYDTDHFSSRMVTVNQVHPDDVRFVSPPITSDPPEHSWSRRILLPAFSPKAIDRWEPVTRQIAADLADAVDPAAGCDAAVDYAQHIPVKVIARMLGVPEQDGDRFRAWIHDVLEEGPGDPDVSRGAGREMLDYLIGHVERHRDEPADDLITFLLDARVDGAPLADRHIYGTVLLLLVAGIDTTWSSIGSALWHLARIDADRERLVAEPELIPTAVEEMLRAYAPVTMARYVAADTELAGCPVSAGQRLLLPFPAGNRDPQVFDVADQVVIDRAENRHLAFGLGIHRCLGSNLARMEITVALQEWLARFPVFVLSDPEAVRWSAGQIRGPRTLPVSFSRSDGA